MRSEAVQLLDNGHKATLGTEDTPHEHKRGRYLREDGSMTPYYADDSVTLFHGDCREVAEWLAAKVLVTDPPYGIGYTLHRPGRQVPIEGDRDTALRDWALTAWGKRPALVFGRWDIPRPQGTLERLVWDKDMLGTGSRTSPWRRSDEEIYMLGEWPPVKPGGRAREGGTPSQSSTVIRVRAHAPGSRDRPDHPTPKPVPLMERLISACPAGVVADPFAGAGATLIAAKLLGRRAIGVELEAWNCKTIARRLTQTAPLLVLDPAPEPLSLLDLIPDEPAA